MESRGRHFVLLLVVTKGASSGVPEPSQGKHIVSVNTTGEVQRQAFPTKLAKQVQSQFVEFSRTDFASHTFERQKSEFHGAKQDLNIFDGSGKLVLCGRDFGDRTFFWQP
jgi:hypothetical protein